MSIHYAHSRPFLIIHQGALGDFLMAVPVFEGLHRLRPGVRFDFCCRPEYAILLADKAYFGNSYSADGCVPSSLYHEALWCNSKLNPSLENAQGIFFFGQEGSRKVADRLSRLVDCPVYWLVSFPPSGLMRQVSRFLLDQLRRAGFDLEYVIPRLKAPSNENNAVQNWIAEQGWSQRPPPILIHPGSGGRGKIWPLSRWWSLLNWLCSTYNHPIVMVLGQADSHLKPFALEAQQKLGVRVLENVTLQRLTALLGQSRLYVGNDSGVSHLAAVVGIRAVVIFGPTQPEIWAPRGDNVSVVQSHWQEPENLQWSTDAAMQPVEEQVRLVIEDLLD